MKRAALALLALSLTGSAPSASVLPSALAFSRPDGGIFVVERSGRERRVAGRGLAPAWSLDGRRLAFVSPSAGGATDLFVADADGSHRVRLTRTVGESELAPGWSPNGRSLVFERDGTLVVVRADGSRERRLGPGRDPDWSPVGGGMIAFVGEREGVDDLYVVESSGGGLLSLTSSDALESEPAWSPDGARIAFVSLEQGLTDVFVLDVQRGGIVRLTEDAALESSPVWSANGGTISFVSDRGGAPGLWSAPAAGGDPVALGGPSPVERFRWRPAISPERRPDLDQRAPADLALMIGHGGRFLLGFTSATDNAGEGPLSIVASRASRALPTMRAAQRVRLAGGGTRTYSHVGALRYAHSPTHEHWHLLSFQRYELRRASDHALVVRDHKAGFCLTDRYTHASPRLAAKRGPLRFTSYCGRGDTRALSVAEGTSVGYADRYPAWFHGQNLDVTRVPDGTYVLVHRTNANLGLRELRYENNAASLRIRLSWPRGRRHLPAVHLLATCPDSEWC